MAHAATIGELADGLIRSITGETKKDASFRKLKDQVVKGLRDQSNAHTNQFAIAARCEGLIEKFAIMNRDDLADGFQSQLDELPTDSRWTPEILSLLVELSDRPLEQPYVLDSSVLDDQAKVGTDLTWKDILAVEPLTEAGIWEDVERDYHSSGDEVSDDEEDLEPTSSTTATSFQFEDNATNAGWDRDQADESDLAHVEKSRNIWSSLTIDEDVSISEISIVREILTMLYGLPTDLFPLEDSAHRVVISQHLNFTSGSKTAILDVLNQATEVGTNLQFLRDWAYESQSVAYLQSVQATAQTLLAKLDSELGNIEQRYISTGSDTSVSIIEVVEQVTVVSRPLCLLSQIIQKSVKTSRDQESFAVLNALYHAVCIAQISNENTALLAIATVFFAALHTYLRSLEVWVVTGSIRARDADVLFVNVQRADCNLGDLWQYRFSLRVQSNGSAHAPKFMLYLIDRMFALGKSRAFVRALGRIEDDSGDSPLVTQSKSILENLPQQLDANGLTPFLQLLGDVLERWIAQISTDSAPLLRSKLCNDHGLSKMLSGLPYVYFSKDGVLLQDFADALFNRLSSSQGNLDENDLFILTEIAHNTLGSDSHVDAENIYLTSTDIPNAPIARSTIRQLESIRLEYHFTWPVQNVTRCSQSIIHAKAFTFLVQIQLAKTALRAGFFSLRSTGAHVPAALALRERLLWFVDLLFSHITTTVCLLHADMQKQIESADGVDSMVSVWAEYEKRLQNSLFLSARLEPIREAITSMLELCESSSITMGPRSAKGMQEQFQETAAFLTAGVRGVSRGGSEPILEVLAERLEWSM